MKKKVVIAGVLAVVMATAVTGSYLAFAATSEVQDTAVSQTLKRNETIAADEREMILNQLNDEQNETVNEYLSKLNQSDDIDLNFEFRSSVIAFEAEEKASVEMAEKVFDLLKNNDRINQDTKIDDLNDRENFFDFIIACCDLYNDMSVELTAEDCVRIEVLLGEAYKGLPNDDNVVNYDGTQYKSEKVQEAKAAIENTIEVTSAAK